MLFLPVLSSLLSLAFVFFLVQRTSAVSVGSGQALEISAAIRQGALSYLKRQGQSVAGVAGLLFLILLFFSLACSAKVLSNLMYKNLSIHAALTRPNGHR